MASATKARADDNPDDGDHWLGLLFARLKNKTTGQRCKARADSNPHGELLARAFSFALGLEVIAHDAATAQTLPPSRMSGVVPRRLVRQAQTSTAAKPETGQCRVSQLVQQADLDGQATACPTGAGAILPGVRSKWLADQSDGGGSHRPIPRGLGLVRFPGESPKPVQVPPRPEDGTRTSPGATLRQREATSALADARACAGSQGRTGAQRRSRAGPPGSKKF